MLKRLSEPIDIAWLAFFRIAFGGLMLWDAYHYLSSGMVYRQFIQPAFHFTYYGFGWVAPWPGQGMYWHFALWAVLAMLILVGLWYRVCAVLFFFSFTFVFLLDQSEYLNHNYLICLVSFLMIFMPAHKSFSLDALRDPRVRAQTVPAWTLWLLRLQIGIVYFYGGIAKIGADWLLHAQPMQMWLQKPFPVLSQFMAHKQIAYFFSWGGFLLDLLIVPLLLWKRTRPFAFMVGVLFHIANSQLFNIGVFPWFMIAGTMLFFSPDWPRRLLARIGRRPARPEPLPSAVEPGAACAPSSWVSGLLILYASFQILMPLRHWLYPGDVNWTEEGHRFSWHMKLRDKEMRFAFAVVDPATKRFWKINPTDYLTPRQANKVGTRPDMILQFAKHLKKEFEKKGRPDVKVHANVIISLNGRKPQPMIDPATDLAAQPRDLLPARWILPLKQPLES